eukprot:12982921-Heterocapsa_arctica.AAC.1
MAAVCRPRTREVGGEKQGETGSGAGRRAEEGRERREGAAAGEKGGSSRRGGRGARKPGERCARQRPSWRAGRACDLAG